MLCLTAYGVLVINLMDSINSVIKKNEQQLSTYNFISQLPLSSHFFFEKKSHSFIKRTTIFYISFNKLDNTILLKLSSSNNATIIGLDLGVTGRGKGYKVKLD